MSNSKNWKATATPSFDGSSTVLRVTGEVRSGTVPLILKKSETKQKLPVNVIALDLLNMVPSSGIYNEVEYEEDITGRDELTQVRIYYDEHNIEAEILIERVITLTS